MKRLSTFIIFLALAVACVSSAAHAARVGVYVGPAYRYYYPVVPVPYYYRLSLLCLSSRTTTSNKGSRQPDRRDQAGPGTTATRRKLTTRM